MESNQLHPVSGKPTPAVSPGPQIGPENSGKSAPLKILIGLLVLVVFGAIGAYAYVTQYRGATVAQETPGPAPSPPEPVPSASSSVVSVFEGSIEYGTPVDVRWNDALQEISPLCPGSCDGSVRTFVAGTITSGPYEDSPLYLNEIASLGTQYEHFVLEGNTQVLLKHVKGIHDVPEYINFPLRAGYRLKKSYGVGTFFEGLVSPRKMFTDPILGDVYLDEDWRCFFVMLPDKTALAYDIAVPFFNRENGNLSATFSGVATEESYEYTRIRGCGALCETLAFVEESALKPDARLTAIGTTSTGESLYGIRGPEDPVLKDLYNDRNTVAYYAEEGWQGLPKSKYSYEQFLGYHPLLYWKDPLGRWVQFTNKRFVVAAEMCKPVIYLYPRQATDLTVNIYPNGGFTYTDPPYDNGWYVRAYPDGTLTDLKTGKRHSYLFWEGIGLNYPESDKGWVVEREDVAQFIDAKLPLLGLQGRELDDFKDYWVSRLTAHPYYQLSFLTQEQFNEIAPLRVSQNPDTAIRILMTAQGLDSFRPLEPQELGIAPGRTGFTLVEWGGVVLK